MWAIGQGGVLSVRCIGLRTIAFLKLNLVKEEGSSSRSSSLACSLKLLTSTALAGGNGA